MVARKTVRQYSECIPSDAGEKMYKKKYNRSRGRSRGGKKRVKCVKYVYYG